MAPAGRMPRLRFGCRAERVSAASATAIGFDTLSRACGLAAERVRVDILDALDKQGSTHTGVERHSHSVRLVSLSSCKPADTKGAIDHQRRRIKTIAETAGFSYMRLVEGC